MGRGAWGCGVGLKAEAAGGADSAEMWEGDEGMSIWAEASGRVAEAVRTDWMWAAQSSKSVLRTSSLPGSGWIGPFDL